VTKRRDPNDRAS